MNNESKFAAAATSLAKAALSLFALFTLATLAGATSPASGSLGPADQPVNARGTANGTGAVDGETGVVEGVNADSFALNVTGLPTDWAGKTIRVTMSWTNPINDYDLYIHQGTLAGPTIASSGNGAPDTTEVAAISPSVTGVGLYTIHIVYFACAPLLDQPLVTASVVGTRTPVYLKSGVTFSPNFHDTSPGSTAVTEPSDRTDVLGNHYACGIHGFPGGCDLWYYDLRTGSPTYDPNMRNPQYRGMPDSFTDNTGNFQAGGDGGGDIELAVGTAPTGPNNVPTLAYASLIAANVSVGNSQNRADSFMQNPLGNMTGGPAADDRQWIEFYGPNTVYLCYRTLDPALAQFQESTDGGLTYGPAIQAGQIGQMGGITVDQNDGTCYIAGGSGVVAVGRPDPITGNITNFTTHAAAADPNGVAHLFFAIRCAADGTVYCCYSNEHTIFVVYSKDHGITWSAPLRISDGPATATSLFPWLACGKQPGSLGVAWLGTSDTVNDDNADWNVFYAECTGVTTNSPIVRQVVASDHVVHCGNISEQGFLGNANRNLGDYFQLSFDTLGAAVIDYCDDHNDFAGQVYSTRQVAGGSINGGRLKKQTEGSALPTPPAGPAPDGSQVVDFRDDVADALLAVIPQDDPLDIISIKYSNETSSTGDKIVVAQMKLSTLQNLAPQSSWQMFFGANAPNATVNATKLYSNALSDRGDEFYVRADYGNGTYSFVYGTAVRTSGGGFTYTDIGAADYGLVDPANNAITIKVAASKLNRLMKHGGPIAGGSVIAGLRGQSYTTQDGGIARSDSTPGGTQFTIQ